MGRRGKNIRKPKRSRPFSNANIKGVDTRSGESLSVQALVQDKSAPFNRGSVKPSAGSNKKRNPGN